MENKKAQALDDDLLENIIGGISLMTICLKTSSAGSASAGFSDIHAETARMSGITNRVLRPVPDAEARIPIRGRHNLRYAIEKPWVETRGFSLTSGQFVL